MTIATKERRGIDRTDKGEWLSRLLEDVQTKPAYAPSPIAVLRMRTRIAEGMVEKVKQAA